jgi:hypothetical protein
LLIRAAGLPPRAGDRSERPLGLLCVKSFDNEPAILANGAAKRVAVVGDDSRGGDLFGLLERMTFDLAERPATAIASGSTSKSASPYNNRALSTVFVGPAIARTLVSSGFESMTAHSERMKYLLAARGRCAVHRHRSRREHLYVGGQVFGRWLCPDPGLMRHLFGLAPDEVALLPAGMIRATGLRLLVTAPRLPHRLAPPCLGTRLLAVLLALVAIGAQEEHLTAPTTDDEAERLHSSGRDLQKLGRAQGPCDDCIVERPRLWTTTEGPRGMTRAFTLSVTRRPSSR